MKTQFGTFNRPSGEIKKAVTRNHSIEEALKILGRDLNTVYLKVDWLNCVDLFFTGTNDYL